AAARGGRPRTLGGPVGSWGEPGKEPSGRGTLTKPTLPVLNTASDPPPVGGVSDIEQRSPSSMEAGAIPVNWLGWTPYGNAGIWQQNRCRLPFAGPDDYCKRTPWSHLG